MKNCYLIADHRIITYKFIKRDKYFIEMKDNKSKCSFRQSIGNTYFEKEDAIYELFRRDCISLRSDVKNLRKYLEGGYLRVDYPDGVALGIKYNQDGYKRRLINPIFVDRFLNEYPEYMV